MPIPGVKERHSLPQRPSRPKHAGRSRGVTRQPDLPGRKLRCFDRKDRCIFGSGGCALIALF